MAKPVFKIRRVSTFNSVNAIVPIDMFQYYRVPPPLGGPGVFILSCKAGVFDVVKTA